MLAIDWPIVSAKLRLSPRRRLPWVWLVVARIEFQHLSAGAAARIICRPFVVKGLRGLGSRSKVARSLTWRHRRSRNDEALRS